MNDSISLSTRDHERLAERSVCVVIVNYRTPLLCIDCLASLEEERKYFRDLSVQLVDNCSGDDSLPTLTRAIAERGWAEWVTLLPEPKNGGFASGNNAAITAQLRKTRPDYFHLLNPDTVIRPGAVATLAAYLESHPDVGIAGSALEDPDGVTRAVNFRFPNILSELDSGLRLGALSKVLEPYLVAPAHPPREPGPADWVSGASFMFRSALLDDVGLMDDGYFLYFEEVDFLLRARRRGWPCHIVPASRVVHLMGKSTKIREATRRPAYWFASRRRYFSRNHGRLYAAGADVAFIVGRLVFEARCKLQGRTHDEPLEFLQDFVRHSVLLNWRAS